MKAKSAAKKFNVKIYDDYNARAAWWKCSGTKENIVKKVQELFSKITEDEVIGMLEDAVNCGKLIIDNFVNAAHVNYGDYWIKIDSAKK